MATNKYRENMKNFLRVKISPQQNEHAIQN